AGGRSAGGPVRPGLVGSPPGPAALLAGGPRPGGDGRLARAGFPVARCPPAAARCLMQHGWVAAVPVDRLARRRVDPLDRHRTPAGLSWTIAPKPHSPPRNTATSATSPGR